MDTPLERHGFQLQRFRQLNLFRGHRKRRGLQNFDSRPTKKAYIDKRHEHILGGDFNRDFCRSNMLYDTCKRTK